MDKYIEAEKKLAGLLGYHQITDGHFSDNRLSALPRGSWLESLKVVLPMWARDNAAAFALMVEHDLCVQTLSHFVAVLRDNLDGNLAEAEYTDHPSKEAAVRYAIIMAVIAKLEAA